MVVDVGVVRGPGGRSVGLGGRAPRTTGLRIRGLIDTPTGILFTVQIRKCQNKLTELLLWATAA